MFLTKNLLYSKLPFLTLILMLTGCSSELSLESRKKTAQAIQERAQLKSAYVKGDRLVFQTFYRFNTQSKTVRIYIEGDGLAWQTRTKISANPTPIKPIALSLMAADRFPSKIYIARPCQYVPMKFNSICNKTYWTSHRFSDDLVEAIDAIIDQTLSISKAKSIELVGFSGGAAIATLVAARRSDVLNIRTVAGNLDHVLLSRIKKVTVLSGSLNPANIADSISNLPQLHFVGSLDQIIDHRIAESYKQQSSIKSCIEIYSVEGASHTKNWESKWKDLLKVPFPDCNKQFN